MLRTINGCKEFCNYTIFHRSCLPFYLANFLENSLANSTEKVTFGMKIIQFEVDCWKFVSRKIVKIGFGTCKLAGDNSLLRRGRSRMKFSLSGMFYQMRGPEAINLSTN